MGLREPSRLLNTEMLGERQVLDRARKPHNPSPYFALCICSIWMFLLSFLTSFSNKLGNVFPCVLWDILVNHWPQGGGPGYRGGQSEVQVTTRRLVTGMGGGDRAGDHTPHPWDLTPFQGRKSKEWVNWRTPPSWCWRVTWCGKHTCGGQEVLEVLCEQNTESKGETQGFFFLPTLEKKDNDREP